VAVDLGRPLGRHVHGGHARKVASLPGEVIEDAAHDGLSPVGSGLVATLPIYGTLLLAAVYLVRRRHYYWLLLEDHPVEWGQFGLLVFAAVAAVLAMLCAARRRRLLIAAVLGVLALGCAGLGGDEISWGQRVFSLASPVAIAADNAQGEISVHNLVVGGFSVDYVALLVELALGLGGAVVALLVRPRRAPWAATWLRHVAPPLITVPGFALVALFQAVMLGLSVSSPPMVIYQEWMELCLYLCLAVTASCCYVRALRWHPAGFGPRIRDRPAGVGRSAPSSRPRTRARSGRRPLIVAAVGAFLLMSVFAYLAAQSRVLPGNVPPSMVSLYGGFP
jgi:hypothetical protein